MFNKRFEGVIKSVSAGAAVLKGVAGTKVRYEVYKVKIESGRIDYESINEFNPQICSTLVNIQPMPFHSIDFGQQPAGFLKLILRELKDENDALNIEAEFGRIGIRKLKVTNQCNLPIYEFSLELPLLYAGRSDILFENLNVKVEFEFCNTKEEVWQK